MRQLKDDPLVLLLATGLLLGLYFPIGKLAGAAGANPLFWAMIISLGPGLILAAVSLSSQESWSRGWGFAVSSGLLAYVVPNAITFSAIPQIGSGLMSLMFACSPVVTAAISMALGVRPPSGKLLAGVALGFAGAMLIALSRNTAQGAEGRWLFLAFVVPLSLGCGNVFRTAYWPQGMSPIRMAAQTNLAAAVPLGLLMLVFSGVSPLWEAADHAWLALAQIAVSTLMFTAFFRLQWVGGPTFLSQIGYVAAAVGLASGVVILGESYPPRVWCGAVLIGLGVAVSNWPARRR